MIDRMLEIKNQGSWLAHRLDEERSRAKPYLKMGDEAARFHFALASSRSTMT